MKSITYLTGDATNPVEVTGRKIIIHVCNTEGKWGAGFVVALSKKWKEPETFYRNRSGLKLGEVQFVRVEKEIAVANMIAQEMGWKDGKPPIRYEAVDTCLKKVADGAKKYGASIVLPYLMGAGLAGGNWNKIEELIIRNLSSNDISVFIYDINNIRPK